MEDWHGSEEKAQVKKYQNLQKVLQQQLRDVKVWNVGKVEVDIFVVGSTSDGAIASIKTKSVET